MIFLRRKRIILFAIVTFCLLLVFLAVGISLLVFKFGDFNFIPQDCLLLQRSVSGQVSNTDGAPILNADVKISNVGGGGLEDGKVNLAVRTDKQGRIPQTPFWIFACDTLKIDISAAGYDADHLSYYADQGYEKSSELIISVTLTPIQSH